MPASNIDLYRMQDARNNFDAMRPAPICADANRFLGQCQNIHISNNCYYGYHDMKTSEYNHGMNDCEMLEAPHVNATVPQSNARKRNADDSDDNSSQNKRIREEVQKKEKNIEPETSENMGSVKNKEDLLEILYWNIHGGHIFHLAQCI